MMHFILVVTDYILYILLALSTIYLFSYALVSLFYETPNYPKSEAQHRFLVIFPAYKADSVIVESVKSFLKQNYPTHLYEVMVVADHMQPQTLSQLEEVGATVVKANYENSSKAKALQLAISKNEGNDADFVVIMDADNITTPYFLEQLNNAFAQDRTKAIQTHRTAKNLDTPIALLDAASEEINNSIFRKGHAAAFLSSALIGSGMAFNYEWFKNHVSALETAGEDKELEMLLLREEVFIEYLNEVKVLDDKTQQKSDIAQQRKRWMAAQYASLRRAIGELPMAIYNLNFSYADKIIQWMLPPRLIHIGAVTFMMILTTIASVINRGFFFIAEKWWGLFGLLVITFLVALPKHLYSQKMLSAIFKLPILIFITFKSMFHLKGVNKSFIHTKH